MQTKQELENWYQKTDPWSYKTNDDDLYRKHRITKVLKKHCKGKSIVDIGAGEGWLTQFLPFEKIYATEISDTARARFPDNVKTWQGEEVDVAITCGTLYAQYNHEEMAKQIKEAQAKYIVVAGIDDWLIDYDFGKVIHQEKYPYREFTQRLTVYETSS